MTDEVRIRKFDVWIVTNGNDDKHISLAERPAREFARIYNRHLLDLSRQVYVERKTAQLQ